MNVKQYIDSSNYSYRINKMKYYETTNDEYTNAVEQYNLHPELKPVYNELPLTLNNFENTIIYGPPGTGKYSQSLYILKRYSPTKLKYATHITAVTDKQSYNYHISDIHYEIDMSLLGCNSKTLWSEIFFQIVDIISMKPDKVGIILCKNFHLIHAELLENFYSYMQQYNHTNAHIYIKFLIITESISFIPSCIVNACQTLHVERPSKDMYGKINVESLQLDNYFNRISCSHMHNMNNKPGVINKYPPHQLNNRKSEMAFKLINETDITNIKELKSFDLIEPGMMPIEVFNIVCDQLILDIESTLEYDSSGTLIVGRRQVFNYIEFRDSLYNILTYNLDVAECLWYIISYFIYKNLLEKEDITNIIEKTYLFFKYYNNNYRPIYHLESIMFYIINKLNKYDEL